MRRSTSTGFTFVELMCASAIFLFGLVALLSLDNAAASEAARASHNARARLLASNVLSLGQVLPLGAVAAWASTPAIATYDAQGVPAPQGTGFFTVTTTSVTTSTQGRDVRVTVEWTEPQATAKRSFTLQRTIPIL